MAEWKYNHKKDSAQIQVGLFRLVVHHYTGYPPEQYLASCGGVFDLKILKSESLEEGKKEAEELLRSYLQSALDALG